MKCQTVHRYIFLNFLGLFSLLVYDFGVKGVEVEEVYDLSKPIERYYKLRVKVHSQQTSSLLCEEFCKGSNLKP